MNSLDTRVKTSENNIFTIDPNDALYQAIIDELLNLKFIKSAQGSIMEQDDTTFLFDNIMNFYIKSKFIKNIYTTLTRDTINQTHATESIILYYVSQGESIMSMRKINGQTYLAIGWFHHYGNHWIATINALFSNGVNIHYSLDDDNLHKTNFEGLKSDFIDPTIKSIVYAKIKNN